jgi:hypothetical protein
MELYDILDDNEIDGQGKDVPILAIDTDIEWNAAMTHPAQNLPAGNYNFLMTWQALASTKNNTFFYRVNGSIILPEVDFYIVSNSGRVQHSYGFNLSWEGGLFDLSIEFARDDATFDLDVEFCEFSVSRRS